MMYFVKNIKIILTQKFTVSMNLKSNIIMRFLTSLSIQGMNNHMPISNLIEELTDNEHNLLL